MSTSELIGFIAGAVFMTLGIFFFVVQFIGIFRYKYVLNRIHAAALGDTMGSGCMILGAICMKGFCASSVKMILLIIFMWITAPVATHMLGKLELYSQKDRDKIAPLIVLGESDDDNAGDDNDANDANVAAQPEAICQDLPEKPEKKETDEK